MSEEKHAIGDMVIYTPKNELGRVKSIKENGDCFVVYHCGLRWDDYLDFTAALTRHEDLRKVEISDLCTKTEKIK